MDPNDELPPSERARDRRRDRDATAKERAGMRTGLAKQFKQVMDTQRRRGEDAARRLERGRGAADVDDDARGPGEEPDPRRPRRSRD